jgi:colanic acid/amylovoran/stewartan biosynthesis glycosyltransferase WcaL/AmsK/CpsK
VSSKPIVAHSVIEYLPFGENWIYTQIVGLKRYRPVVLTKRGKNLDYFSLSTAGGEIVPAYTSLSQQFYEKVAKKFFCHQFPAYFRTFERTNPVILHSHFAQHAYDDLGLRRRFEVPHVVSCYGADLWKFAEIPAQRRRYRVVFGEADMFLVEGNAMRQRAIDLGCQPEKVRVHHLGIDLQRIRYVARTPAADGTVRCLMAGRAIEKKGFLYGLKAFANVAARHSNVHLTIMAWGEAAYKRKIIAELKHFASTNNLSERVTWYGLQPYHEYLRITEASHVFMVPSVLAANGDAEGGCPVTAMELSAAGMPIVGFAHCDIPEVVQDGVSGFLVPERDVDALTGRLEQIVTRPQTWESMGQAGRKHITKQYNATTQVNGLEDIYDELLARGRQPMASTGSASRRRR